MVFYHFENVDPLNPNLEMEKLTFSRFIWIIFSVAASKQTQKDSKPFIFVFTREQPTLNGREKNKTSFEFLFYVTFTSINKKYYSNKTRKLVQYRRLYTSIEMFSA